MDQSIDPLIEYLVNQARVDDLSRYNDDYRYLKLL